MWKDELITPNGERWFWEGGPNTVTRYADEYKLSWGEFIDRFPTARHERVWRGELTQFDVVAKTVEASYDVVIEGFAPAPGEAPEIAAEKALKNDPLRPAVQIEGPLISEDRCRVITMLDTSTVQRVVVRHMRPIR